MSTTTWIGVGCLVYAAITIALPVFRPARLWKIPKIQAFVSVFGETGARLFIGGFGLVVAVPGVLLLTVG